MKNPTPENRGQDKDYNPIVAHCLSVMCRAALRYASCGFAVLPCQETGPHAKAPYIKGGFTNASSDPETIKQWWHTHPQALIGLAIPPGVFVLDFDTLSLDQFKTTTGINLPLDTTSITGRETIPGAGLHVWLTAITAPDTGITYPRTQSPLTLKGERLAGVDVRLGGKGYVIAPPSTHPVTGRAYYWRSYTWPPPPTPLGLLGLMSPTKNTCPPRVSAARRREYSRRRRQRRGVVGILRRLENARPGERNSVLFWAACRMWERFYQGAPLDFDQLITAAKSTGLSDREIQNTITSARQQTLRCGKAWA